MEKNKIVFFTGAGISKESGISTFRDSDGLWENVKVSEIATKKAWQVNRSRMLDFYNDRRKALKDVHPNPAHKFLADLEEKYNVVVVTQNVDDLHERAGSTNVVHVHGELMKMRSSLDPKLVYDCNEDIEEGQKCEKGSQLRPNVVWFGEDVPLMEEAFQHASEADIFVIIGTSMQVYPAAQIINHIPHTSPIFYIDPSTDGIEDWAGPIEHIVDTAVSGVEKLKIYLEALDEQQITT